MMRFIRLRHRTAKRSKPARMVSVIEPRLLAYIAMKNLMSKRMRSILTVGGIIIGVGAIVFLVSLAQGLHQTVNHYVIGSKSVEAIDVTSSNSATLPLTNEKVNKIRDFAHVTQADAAYVMPGKISDHGSLTDAVLYGTNNPYINLSALKLVAGKGSLQNSKDVIISSSLLDLIGQSDANKAIGQQLSVSTTFTVADGSTKKFSGTFTIAGVADISSGVAVYMDGQTFAAAGAAEYGQVKVVADNQTDVTTIRDQISGLGLTTTSPLDTLNEINTIFTIFTGIVIGFGGIGVVIAVLGMFNTMTISLLERTSEIGLMITIGARKADVQRLLIFEALLLSLLGGVGGIIAAWVLGLIINVGLTYFANSRGVQGTIDAFMVTPLLVVATICFALLVGFLVALYPSRRAAKINPIDVLRHE